MLNLLVRLGFLLSHKRIWGKDAKQVIYGQVDKNEEDERLCPICNSRINEFGDVILKKLQSFQYTIDPYE